MRPFCRNANENVKNMDAVSFLSVTAMLLNVPSGDLRRTASGSIEALY